MNRDTSSPFRSPLPTTTTAASELQQAYMQPCMISMRHIRGSLGRAGWLQAFKPAVWPRPRWPWRWPWPTP